MTVWHNAPDDAALEAGDYVRIYEDRSYIVFDANGIEKRRGALVESSGPMELEVKYSPPVFSGAPKGFKNW